MMKFLHPVTTFCNTGKSAKGKILQDLAKKFDYVLVHGDNSISQIVLRMREIAAVIDARYPRTRPTFVEWYIDNEGNGQIWASPVNDNGATALDQDYFRINFNTVRHSATIDEIIDRFTLSSIEKGGEK